MFNNIRTDFRRYNLQKRQCAFNFFFVFQKSHRRIWFSRDPCLSIWALDQEKTGISLLDPSKVSSVRALSIFKLVHNEVL